MNVVGVGVRARWVTAAVLWMTTLCGCDPNVIVGRAALRNMPDAARVPDASAADGGGLHDAQTSVPDASDDQDSGALPDAAVYVPPKITWVSGSHSGNELAPYTAFGDFRGRPLGIATLYPDRTSWVNVVTPGWPIDTFKDFKGQLVLSEPLYPEGGLDNNQDCAAGMYDAQWNMLGSFLVSKSRANAIIRLGWGWNDQAHAWRADTDVTDWIACFRHVVQAIRATDPQVQIDWTFNPAGPPNIRSSDPYAAYPGDDYVDFIGMEAFDEYPPTKTAAAWDAKCNSQAGLCKLMSFARAHKKRAGIAEWGVVSCGMPKPNELGGDNPFFIRKMVETFAANADLMAYDSYFEDGGNELCSDLDPSMDKNPKAAAEYQLLYRK